MDVVSHEFGTLASDFCLSFNFAVVFSSMYFRSAKYGQIIMRFPLEVENGDVEEIEMVRRGRRRW
jgi:hypothetical protein